MSLDYPIQIAHTISDDEAGKLLRFQQTAVRGEKVYFSDTRNEYIALNDAADRHGTFSSVTGSSGISGYARFNSTGVALPSIGDKVQIMNCSYSGYVGTDDVIATGATTFDLSLAFVSGGSGYWKREANVRKLAPETYEASNINYNNSISLLSGDNIQDVIDEIVDDYTDGLFNLDTDLQGQLNDIRFPVSSGSLSSDAVLDYFAHENSKGTVKWLVQLDDSTTLRSSEILANYNGSGVVFNEYSILENTGNYAGAVLLVSGDATNVNLVLNVTGGNHSTNILRIAKW